MDNDEENPTNRTVERIRVLMTKHGWSQNDTARYFGVPLGTMGNWLQGTRKPPAVATRLVEVLQLVDMFAPSVRDHLMSDLKGT